MKFYGNANLQQNELQNAVLTTLSSFPASPKVGQVAFVNGTVYICASITPAPAVWVPLSQQITAYAHNQGTASTTWTITHNMNTSDVSVQVYDDSSPRLMLIPDEVEVTSVNSCIVRFSTAVAGRAIVVTGFFTGQPAPTVSYTHTQSQLSSTWTINHSLNRIPIVRVFVGQSEVQPESITHNSMNQLTITFLSPQSGIARLI